MRSFGICKFSKLILNGLMSVMDNGRQWMGRDSASGVRVTNYQNTLCCLAAFLIVLLLPYVHIGIIHLKFWVPDKSHVDKENCTCSCFDTVYKGTYEHPGNVRYKHMYFNATHQTFKIWLLTLAFILVFFECLKHLLSLWLQSRLCWKMFAVFVSDIYPNYYSWWVVFNYYNDDYYEQLYHQLFFSTTELVATAVVVKLCDSNKKITLVEVVIICSVGCIHLLVGGIDQFVSHLLFGQGKFYQNFRNIELLIPDFLFILVPLYEFYRHNYVKRFSRFHCASFIILTTVGVCVSHFLMT